MKKDLTCILDARNGKGAIYISGIDAAMCLNTLRQANIQAVLSVARAAQLSHPPTEVPRYLFLPAQDKETYQIAQHFDETFKFIDQARAHTNVLVHCMAGISRSATVIAAYLIRKWGYSVRGVLDLMQGRRQKVCPNRGFIRQLKKIEPRRKQRTICRKLDNEATNVTEIRSSSHSPTKNQKINDSVEAERKMTESSFTSNLGDQDMVKFNRSQIISKGCDSAKLSEAKTAAKIEKLKSSLIQDMLKSRMCPEQLPAAPQALSFSALLQSKIYKNKLRLRETVPQPMC